MLKIKKLSKKFGSKVVLDNITFTFEDGVYGLLGPNGAGKTTLMRCITGLYNSKKDTIFFNDVSINDNKDYLKNIGYLPQKFGLFKDLKVFEMMQLFANIKHIDAKQSKKLIYDSIELVNLTDRIDSKIRTLSGGMIRRLGIAQAILNNPQIIIFDEPTAGLDPEERLRFKNIISEIKDGKTIIISTHIVEDVEAVCDKVAVMKSNNFARCGSCKEIQDVALNKVYKVPDDDTSRIRGNYIVQKKYEQDGETYYKILSNMPQTFAPELPNVEDGYICIIRDI